MMNNNRLIGVLISLLLSSQVFARDIPIENNAAFLVSACREVVEIYDKHGEAKLLAAQRTSLNEGIRAGYCMGVTQQYRKSSHNCDSYSRSWFEMAEKIADANLTTFQLNIRSTNSILRAAYCGL